MRRFSVLTNTLALNLKKLLLICAYKEKNNSKFVLIGEDLTFSLFKRNKGDTYEENCTSNSTPLQVRTPLSRLWSHNKEETTAATTQAIHCVT